MGVGRTIGTIGGGIIGGVFGGPGGAMIGAGAGGMLGGEFDSANTDGSDGSRSSRNTTQYGSSQNTIANAEAERASQLGAAGAAGTRELGTQLGYGTNAGIGAATISRQDADRRAAGLYGGAAGSYGAAAGADRMQQGARGDAMAGIGRLQQFYQQGPGPSAAEAQMRAGADSASRNAMALARTGGGSANSVRAAIRAGAAGQQQTNQAAAGLRAQEAANWRQTQLGAMGQEQQALGNVRAGDMSAMGQHYGAAGQQLGAAGQQGQLGLGYGQLGAQYTGLHNNVRMGAEGMAISQQQAGEQQRGNILGQQLGADVSRYGADKGVAVGMAGIQQRQDAANMAMAGSLIGTGANMYTQQQAQQQTSDIRAKENIRPTSAADLISRLDESYAREGANVAPANDLRAAGSYSYDYRDPAQHGGGSHVGPMAQELEHTAAAGAVSMGPDGMRQVDPGRLTMTNTAAIGEQQRRLDRLEAMATDKQGGDWQPQGAETQGQRIVRKTEAYEDRRMPAAERRAMMTFGNSGSLRPQDEEFLRQNTPPKRMARAR